MIARNPSAVPFGILLLLVVGNLRIVPEVMLRSTTPWAVYWIALTLGGVATLWLLSRTNRLILWDSVVASMWSLPALILARRDNGLALICLFPLCFALRRYLPKTPPPPAHAFQSAILLQAGFGLFLAGNSMLALIPTSLGILLVLWAKEQGQKRLRFRLISAAVAATLVLILISPSPLLFPRSASADSTPAPEKTNRVRGGRSNSAYLGLIFRPDLKSEDKKLPPPPDLKIRSLKPALAEPVEIPFSGVYWLYQKPLIRPPSDAPLILGSPADRKYSSDDEQTPLRFEAIQSFGRAFPMRRLLAIAVKFESKDPYPATLQMELIACNSTGVHPRTSFGRQPIGSYAGPQTIVFLRPAASNLDEFDSLEVRVHLGVARWYVAPKLEVKSFCSLLANYSINPLELPRQTQASTQPYAEPRPNPHRTPTDSTNQSVR